MFIVTNREVNEKIKTIEAFGKEPNKLGPNELRMAFVQKKAKAWQVNILPDSFSELPQKDKQSVTFPEGYKPEYTSGYVAARIMQQARDEQKNILFFVHGYNNNVESLLNRMEILANLYNVIPVGFSWPANGGGARGTMDYLSDKRDARASTGALERTLEKAAQYLTLFNAPIQNKLFEMAGKKKNEDEERRMSWLTNKIREKCPFKVTLLCHSMGNYLYKQMLKSSVTKGNPLLFDNVLLVAADVNLKDHELWVDKIKFRKRLYVAINENDGPLGVSRMKMGENQLERLGHSTTKLSASNPRYIDFTHAAHIKDSHSYFHGEALINTSVKKFWEKAINGEVAEEGLTYLADSNLFRV